MHAHVAAAEGALDRRRIVARRRRAARRGEGGQVGTQLIGVASTLAWSGALTFVILKVIDALVGLRVTSEEETEGLDTTQHNEAGYNL